MRKKYRLTLFVIAFLLQHTAKAQMADSVKNYIDTAIGIVQQHSLYSNRVNWIALREQVLKKAATATSKAQTFEALTIVLDALGDKHAAFYQYDDAYRLPDTALEKRYDDSIKAAWKKGPVLKDTMLGNIAYINVPFMGANKQKDIDWYANWLYNAAAKLAGHNPAGWIIDLRLNGGGNIRPMMQGLAMFFDDGILSCYVTRNGEAIDEASIKDGNFLIDGEVQASINTKTAGVHTSRVAVLVGPGTASSGEGLAANFKQRAHTRLFGEVTSGRANATNGFVFNDDQSYFLISTAYLGDKNKKALPEFVTPHITVKANNAFNDAARDNVVKAALDWLKQE